MVEHTIMYGDPTHDEIITFVLHDVIAELADTGVHSRELRERTDDWMAEHPPTVLTRVVDLLKWPPDLVEAAQAAWEARFPLVLAAWMRRNAREFWRQVGPLDEVVTWPERPVLQLVRAVSMLPPRQATPLLCDLREYVPRTQQTAHLQIDLALGPRYAWVAPAGVAGGVAPCRPLTLARQKLWTLAPWAVQLVGLLVWAVVETLAKDLVEIYKYMLVMQLPLGIAVPWLAHAFHVDATRRDAARCYARGTIFMLASCAAVTVIVLLALLI